MKEIVCKNGEVCLVDDDDFEKLKRYNWLCKHNKCGMYAYRTFATKSRRQTSWMHKEIMGMVGRNVLRVDHIDFNGLNNQKYNLRKCTHAQNNCYKRSATNSSSKYLGVCFDKQTKKWRATIFKNYQQYRLGRFGSEEEAATAYNAAALKHHGEFANLNQIQ